MLSLDVKKKDSKFYFEKVPSITNHCLSKKCMLEHIHFAIRHLGTNLDLSEYVEFCLDENEK